MEKRVAEKKSPSQRIDVENQRARRLAGEMLSSARTVVKEADPEGRRGWKWRGVPVVVARRMICTGETYKKRREDDLRQRAALKDPSGLFNSSL